MIFNRYTYRKPCLKAIFLPWNASAGVRLRISGYYGAETPDGIRAPTAGKCASGQHFMRKAVIFAQGDILQNVYLIRRGTIKVSIPGRAGKEHIVRLSGARDLIGYQSVLTENISPTTATAMTPTEVCVIPKSCFFSLLRSNNTLARRILSMLAREIENAQYRMYSLSYKSVRARIAESLLAMARYYGYQPTGTPSRGRSTARTWPSWRGLRSKARSAA